MTVELSLAGFLLNTSGGFTGWLFAASLELPTLNLLPAVTLALANSTYANDGAFGGPVHTGARSSPPSWWLFGSSSWSLVSGIIAAAKLIGMVWTTTIASMVYVGELYAEALGRDLHVISRLRSVLREVGRIVYTTFDGLVRFLSSELGILGSCFH